MFRWEDEVSGDSSYVARVVLPSRNRGGQEARRARTGCGAWSLVVEARDKDSVDVPSRIPGRALDPGLHPRLPLTSLAERTRSQSGIRVRSLFHQVLTVNIATESRRRKAEPLGPQPFLPLRSYDPILSPFPKSLRRG